MVSQLWDRYERGERMTTFEALDILSMSEQACWQMGYGEREKKEAIETIREALDCKPTATPERPKGEWKYVHEGVSTYKVVCSECDCVLAMSEGGFASMDDFKQCVESFKTKFDNFCHNCGTDMREVKE